MKNLLIAAFAFFIIVGCNTQKSTDSTQSAETRQQGERGQRGERGEKGQRPSIDEVFQMDANNDGKLDKSEVTGRLEKDFARFDINGDGFITRSEFENAPKPERGQRPGRN